VSGQTPPSMVNMPFMAKYWKSPMILPPPSPKAKENPSNIQVMETTPIEIRLIIIVFKTFCSLTNPP